MKEFYYGLNDTGLFIFFSFLFLILFFLFLIVILLLKNKNLKKKYSSLKKELELKNEFLNTEEEFINDQRKIKHDYVDKVKSIKTDLDEIKRQKKEEEKNKHIPKEVRIVEDKKDNNKEVKYQKVEKKQLYNNNNYRPSNGYRISSVGIIRDDTEIEEKKEKIKKQEEKEIKKEDISNEEILAKEKNKGKNKENDNISFMNEVSKKMEEANVPSNIELTEYEKKQEEEAIISYKELIENKDKLYNITDDEENFDFIEELKSLRKDL